MLVVEEVVHRVGIMWPRFTARLLVTIRENLAHLECTEIAGQFITIVPATTGQQRILFYQLTSTTNRLHLAKEPSSQVKITSLEVGGRLKASVKKKTKANYTYDKKTSCCCCFVVSTKLLLFSRSLSLSLTILIYLNHKSISMSEHQSLSWQVYSNSTQLPCRPIYLSERSLVSQANAS